VVCEFGPLEKSRLDVFDGSDNILRGAPTAEFALKRKVILRATAGQRIPWQIVIGMTLSANSSLRTLGARPRCQANGCPKSG
jgi:hypothetical protein